MIKSSLNGEGCRMFSNLLNLQVMLKLKNNWNGFNAPKIPKKVIRIVSAVIKNLNVQPEIFPTGRKSLQLEYHRDKNYLEIEVFRHKIIMYQEMCNVSTECKISRKDIQTIVERFLGGINEDSTVL